MAALRPSLDPSGDRDEERSDRDYERDDRDRESPSLAVPPLPEAREYRFEEREVDAVSLGRHVRPELRGEQRLASAARARLLPVQGVEVVVETPEHTLVVDAEVGGDGRNIDREVRRCLSRLDPFIELVSVSLPDRPE